MLVKSRNFRNHADAALYYKNYSGDEVFDGARISSRKMKIRKKIFKNICLSEYFSPMMNFADCVFVDCKIVNKTKEPCYFFNGCLFIDFVFSNANLSYLSFHKCKMINIKMEDVKFSIFNNDIIGYYILSKRPNSPLGRKLVSAPDECIDYWVTTGVKKHRKEILEFYPSILKMICYDVLEKQTKRYIAVLNKAIYAD